MLATLDAAPRAPPPGGPVPEYPQSLVPVGHVEPAPRRVRAFLGGRTVLDTHSARYVWEWPHYPQYYVPRDDVDASLLVDERAAEDSDRGTAQRHGLRVGEARRPGAALVYGADAPDALRNTVRFEWSALDAWFEEDEEVFVHPRNPCARADALRSTAPSASSSTGSCWPSRRPRCWSSRPACPRGPTCRGRRWTSPTWCPVRPGPGARTRGARAPTGRRRP